MTGLLFTTSSSADHKALNLLLLYIRDWEYGLGDSFQIITSKQPKDIKTQTIPSTTKLEAQPTSPPLTHFSNNQWANSPLSEVEAYCLALNPEAGNLYVALDDTGIQNRTCILGHQAIVKDPTTRRASKHASWFQKIRVPWDELYMTWCNLDSHNMVFEDFVRDRRSSGGDEDGWFEYCNHATGSDLSEDNLRRRDAQIERLKGDGMI